MQYYSEKYDRRPFSESRPDKNTYINNFMKNPSISIRKNKLPEFKNETAIIFGKSLKIPSNQTNSFIQADQIYQTNHTIVQNPLASLSIEHVPAIQSKKHPEFPTFKSFSNLPFKPKVNAQKSANLASSQEIIKHENISLTKIRQNIPDGKNLQKKKGKINNQDEKINFLKEKLTKIDFFNKKLFQNCSAQNFRKSSGFNAMNESLNQNFRKSTGFNTTNELKDFEKNTSSIFMKEMEDKEREDHSYDMIALSTSLENIKSNEILLIRSIYQNRPPTIFFKYPKICGQQSQDYSLVLKINEQELQNYDFNCRISNDVPVKCVKLAFQAGGFEITTEGKDWNVFWGFVKPETSKLMNQYQKTNHFPGCWHLGRKDNLYRHVLHMKQKHGEEFDFVPKTYLLSSEYKRFLIIRKNSDSKSLWIMKPCNQACGRGVKVIDKKSKIDFKKDYLISEYINNPHLINDLKYDLRVYVLITSFDPLRVYFYKEGLVRFATEKYSLSKKKIKKRYVHLTNYSVNKKALKYKQNLNSSLDGEGSKWSFGAYKKKLAELGIDSNALFDKIHDLIIKVCISVESFMLNSINKMTDHRNNCFELYGFDVLIDSNLKPWLMEVNVSPSLSSSSPLDAKIKTSLISDILNLIGLKVYDKKKLNENIKERFLNEEKKNINSNAIHKLSDLNQNNCLKKLTTENWNVLFENEEEYARKGQFQRIFPKKENIDFYSKFFESTTINNLIWWKYLNAEEDFLELICKKEKLK